MVRQLALGRAARGRPAAGASAAGWAGPAPAPACAQRAQRAPGNLMPFLATILACVSTLRFISSKLADASANLLLMSAVAICHQSPDAVAVAAAAPLTPPAAPAVPVAALDAAAAAFAADASCSAATFAPSRAADDAPFEPVAAAALTSRPSGAGCCCPKLRPPSRCAAAAAPPSPSPPSHIVPTGVELVSDRCSGSRGSNWGDGCGCDAGAPQRASGGCGTVAQRARGARRSRGAPCTPHSACMTRTMRVASLTPPVPRALLRARLY